MSQNSKNLPALAVAEAILGFVAVSSASELEKQLEAGRAVMDERGKKRSKMAERKAINQQAKGLVPALICAHGANTAIEGTQSEVISSGVSDSLKGVITDVFPNMPQDGPAAGFPVRHLRSKIRALHQSGKLDDRQMKVLVCAVRKANNAIAGENPKTPKPTRGGKRGDEVKDESKVGRLLRGPRKITDVLLNRMPETIRAAANRLKAKPTRQSPVSTAGEVLLADCERYFEALESAGKGLGRRLAEYADVLRTHEHDRGDEDRMIEWLVQFPPEPPEPLRALLAGFLDWVPTGRKDE